jgi:hypothetical protein
MSPVQLRWVSVLDGTGFSEPVEAFRLLLPEEWRPEGGVLWLPDRSAPATCVQVHFRALSPDGAAGVEFLPHYVWSWSDDPEVAQQLASEGGSMMPPLSAAEFVRTMVLPSQRPGSYILGSAQDPAAAHQRALRSPTEGGWTTSDVARVRITWRLGRTPVEEDVYCAVDDLMSYVPTAEGTALHHALVAQDIICVRFPVGKYATWAPLLDTIVDSVTHNPEWSAAVQQAMDGRIQAALPSAPTAIGLQAIRYDAGSRAAPWAPTAWTDAPSAK